MQFSGLQVAPYESVLHKGPGGALHKGGPLWPDWDTQHAARHCRAGAPVDERPDAPEVTARIGEAQWGGPIVHHFGHMIADFGMRILPSVFGGVSAPLLFYGFPDMPYRRHEDRLRATPRAFQDMLAYAGLGAGDVRIEVDGIEVDTLHVAPQAEQLGGPGPAPDHLDALDAHAERRFGPARREGAVFVSRAGMAARFAGESYIEVVIAEAGVRIMRPEAMSLEDQLRAYRSAGQVIFSEGSAMHTPQLLGHCFDDVVVFKRRAVARELNRTSLAPRSRSIAYHTFLRGAICMLTPDGRQADWLGQPLVDEAAFLEMMRGIGHPVDHLWNSRAFREAESADVAQWLNYARTTRFWENPASKAHIDETLHAHFGAEFRVL